MSDKIKFPKEQALAVARVLIGHLEHCCSRWMIAGSLRREKEQVGDIEILYIPGYQEEPSEDFFAPPVKVSKVDLMLDKLVNEGILKPRVNKAGSLTWGAQNKLALHVTSGIPVDFFATTAENWWNYLVCRTGGAETNKRICMAAQARGMKWHPYSNGFTNGHGKTIPVHSEEDVFRLVGLPYQLPYKRV